MTVTRMTGQQMGDGQITHADVAAANIDGVAATPSMRTLGTGAQQACAGNDARLDAVPTTITVEDTTDDTCYIGLYESATGNLAPKTDEALRYKAGSPKLLDLDCRIDLEPAGLTNGQNAINVSMGNVVAAGVDGFRAEGTSSARIGILTQNSGSGTAIMVMRVLGAGDAYANFDINGGQSWTIGLDNSDSDSFVISASASLGTSNCIKILTTGEVGLGMTPTKRLTVAGGIQSTPSGLADGDNIINVSVGTLTGSLDGLRLEGTLTGNLAVLVQNSGAGNATQFLRVLGAGDAFTKWHINGGQNWCAGLDNSDSDAFKISGASSLGTSDYITILTTGEVGAGGTPVAKLHVFQPTLGSEVFRLQSTATNDDPNYRVFQNRVTTTDATQTTLHTIAISASNTYIIEARVVARRTGGTAGTAEDGAAYVIRAAYKTVAGTVTLIGVVDASYTAESQAGWDATFTISGSNVLVSVTGATDNNVTWHCTVSVSNLGS